MILVTGANGKTGQAIIRALAAGDEAVRALVYRAEQIAPAKAAGARETVVGDLRDGATLRQAADGVRAVYHICPNAHSDEILIGRNAPGFGRSNLELPRREIAWRRMKQSKLWTVTPTIYSVARGAFCFVDG